MRVFISYRREDTAHVAGRLYDGLTNRFGSHHIFKDVDSIPPGTDFREHLNSALSGADVVIALIGDAWLTCKNPDGARRIDSDHDYVRIELESALSRGIPVIPLMSGKGGALKADDLPPSLKPLAYRQIMYLRVDPDFRVDLERLANHLDRMLNKPLKKDNWSPLKVLVGSAILLIATMFVLWVPISSYLRAKSDKQDIRSGTQRSSQGSQTAAQPAQAIGHYQVELELVKFIKESRTRMLEKNGAVVEEAYSVDVPFTTIQTYSSRQYPKVEPFIKDDKTYYKVTLESENETTILTVAQPPKNVKFIKDETPIPAPASDDLFGSQDPIQ